MDNDKIFELIKAGFNAEEIKKIIPISDEGSEESKPPMEQGAGDSEHESEVTPTEGDKTIDDLTATIKELKETVKALQESNAKNAKTEKVGVSDKIADTMKSFIDTL